MDTAFPFLGFDLSTPATLVALVTSPERMLSRRITGGNRAEGLFPAIEDVLDEAGLAMRDVRSVGVGRGPGAFTGIRNAVMAAKTLAWANGIPLYAPGTLEVLARGAGEGDVVVPLIDARRGEVYCHVYLREEAGLTPAGGPAAVPPGDLAGLIVSQAGGRDGEVVLVGTGAMAYRDVLEPLGRVASDPYPLPEALWESCRLAILADRAEDPLGLLPLYVRDPDAVARRPHGRP
jgi:tRNA threonylcarbamoyladenosine biosynthesis protein TsaB